MTIVPALAILFAPLLALLIANTVLRWACRAIYNIYNPVVRVQATSGTGTLHLSLDDDMVRRDERLFRRFCVLAPVLFLSAGAYVGLIDVFRQIGGTQ